MQINVPEKFKKFLFLIPLLTGIAVMIAAGMSLYHHATYAKTVATILSIDVDPGVGEDDTTNYTVIVEYRVDGQTYYGDLGELENGYTVGKRIEILYDPNDPAKIQTTDKIGPAIAVLVGALFAGIGVYMLVKGKNGGPTVTSA